MVIKVEKSFQRDVNKITDLNLLRRLRDKINEINQLPSFSKIPNKKKLQSYNSYYRIKIGNYRIGLMVKDNKIILIRFLHRKDIYKYFP